MAGRGGTGAIVDLIHFDKDRLGHVVPDQLEILEVEQVLDTFFDEIGKRLAEGGRVELRGFGASSTRERGARKGRNPRTGEAVEVPEKKVPYFKPGKEMRRVVNDD